MLHINLSEISDEMLLYCILKVSADFFQAVFFPRFSTGVSSTQINLAIYDSAILIYIFSDL